MTTSNESVDPVQKIIQLDASTAPSGEISDTELVGLAELAVAAAGDHDDDLRQAAESIRLQPSSATASWWLGRLLAERGAPRLGANLLLAVLHHSPPRDRPVALALMVEAIDAIEHADEPTVARRTFEACTSFGWQDEAVLRYRHAFSAVCAGDLIPAGEVIATLPAVGPDAWTHSRLADVLDRAERLGSPSGLDLSELRCWHLVAYGTLLMRRFEGDGEAENGGRFGWLQLSEHDVVSDLDLALEALQIASGGAITSVASPSDKASRVLATLVSERRHLRWVDVNEIGEQQGEPGKHCLVVSGDSQSATALRSFRGDHRTWWYSATLDWNCQSISCDAVGVATELVRWPWEGGLAVGVGGPVTPEADEPSARELGEALATLVVDPSPDRPLVCRLAETRRDSLQRPGTVPDRWTPYLSRHPVQSNGFNQFRAKS